jgi:predicted RNA methylase
MCELSDYDNLILLAEYRKAVESELETWHRAYLPVGRAVLDLGAGCGETALFYLKHGAEKVVCIEANPDAIKCLRANFDSDPRVLIVESRIDSIKVDIEGAEEGMVLETHWFNPKLKQTKLWGNGISLWRLEKTRIPHLSVPLIRRKLKELVVFQGRWRKRLLRF